MDSLGIIFALIALVSWGFGDFFIQRTSRDFGIWPSIFCITGAGSIVLFPFVIGKISSFTPHLGLLFLVALITLVVAITQFRALKIGKLSVVEPIMSFELPLTVLLSVALLREHIGSIEVILIALVFTGILLVGYQGKIHSRHFFERGALLALVSTCIMALVNFTTGLASQSAGPVVTIWFTHTFLALVCVTYFTFKKSWNTFFHHIKKHPYESIAVAIFDNSAWLAYGAAVVLIPISLAITISESYIILAVLLGVIINKERLSPHQWFGAGVSILAVLILSFIS